METPLSTLLDLIASKKITPTPALVEILNSNINYTDTNDIVEELYKQYIEQLSKMNIGEKVELTPMLLEFLIMDNQKALEKLKVLIEVDSNIQVQLQSLLDSLTFQENEVSLTSSLSLPFQSGNILNLYSASSVTSCNISAIATSEYLGIPQQSMFINHNGQDLTLNISTSNIKTSNYTIVVPNSNCIKFEYVVVKDGVSYFTFIKIIN